MPSTTADPCKDRVACPGTSAQAMKENDSDPALQSGQPEGARSGACGPSPRTSPAAGKRSRSPAEASEAGAAAKKGGSTTRSAGSSPPPRLGSSCSFSSADTTEGGEACKGCDNLPCVQHGGAAESEDEEVWGGWTKDRVVKSSNGMYKAWYPRVESQLVTLSSSEISCDLTAIHYPGTFHVGQKVLVEYDDGITYPGAIVALGARNKWRIRLDEGTTFMTTLPDPDVQVLEEEPKGRRASDAGGRSKRPRTSTWARRGTE